jgi:NAD(P)-dependent dehydrogenase (short-subunit alcohol dehydrogenase family)
MTKVVVITGTNSGIGLDTALSFARAEYLVYAGMRDLKKGKDLLEKAEKESIQHRIHLFVIDVTSSESVEKAFQDILKENHVDVLVNNSGL